VSALPPEAVLRVAMEAALEEARLAAAAEEVPVGAVVLQGDRIIARAQNRMRRDTDATRHAELLAMQSAMQQTGAARLTGCTLVVTLEPCAMCAGAIVLARPDALVFGAWDDKAGMCGSVGDLVRHPKLNHRLEVQGGVHADTCRALLQDFFSQRRG
jgi:tRNA(adenine34) deaminase